jgi:CelD/BcsL family acetyltransferase involved in cellulose biosynthesis
MDHVRLLTTKTPEASPPPRHAQAGRPVAAVRVDMPITPDRLRSLPIAELSHEQLASWAKIHSATTAQATPFLHPGWARTVAEVRRGVEVGLMERHGEPVGFVPFQRTSMGIGRPVGSRLCDLSSAATLDGVEWEAEELARAARLRALALFNVPSTSRAFSRFIRGGVRAPYIDVSSGFDAYRKECNASSQFLRQTQRKANKLEREVGPLRFEWHTDDARAFDLLVEWKGRQRRATRTPDILRLSWSRELLQRIRRLRTDGFGGVLSVLYAGDTVAFVHLGMYTRSLLHYWLPAYNRELGAYSPGAIGVMELAREAASRGFMRIDLGPGEEHYKTRAATGTVELGRAVVAVSPAADAATRVLWGVRQWSLESKLLGGWLRRARRAAIRAAYAVRGTRSSR